MAGSRGLLLLLAAIALLAQGVHSQDTEVQGAQTVFSASIVNGSIYTKEDTLAPLHLNIYGIPVPSEDYVDGDPDILITLEALGSAADPNIDLFCNPGFGAYADVSANYPSPLNYIWGSDLSHGINEVFISKNDPMYKPVSAENATYQPYFICSVINQDAVLTTSYVLTANILVDNMTLAETEQQALARIFASCCTITESCSTWKQENAGYEDANGGAVVTDFCSFPGQVCTPSGHLYRLNLNNYGLSCAWPGQYLSAFSQLSDLNLGDNAGLSGTTTDVLGTVANLTRLQFLDLYGDIGISGYVDSQEANNALCKWANSTLVGLDLGAIGIQGSIPDCLINSTVVESLRLGYNNFTGSIPNVFMDGSSMEELLLYNNDLTGPIPSSIVNATSLVYLDFSYNTLTGGLPTGIPAIEPLQTFIVKYNKLSGTIPDSYASSVNLQTFDVKENSFTSYPSAWANASSNLTNSTLVNVRLSFNEIQGSFPSGLMTAPLLTYLIINKNKMDGPLPSNSSMFPGLRALNASHNSFRGTIAAAWNQSGIFTLNAVYVDGEVLEHVFDLSVNQLTGTIPAFLDQSNVNSWVQNGIFLEGNELAVQCSSNFAYLPYLCPEGQTAFSPSGLTTGSSPPAASSTNGSGIVQVQAPTASGTYTPGVASTNSDNASPTSSGGGLSEGAKWGIAIGVLLAVAIIAGAAFYFISRRRRLGGSKLPPTFHTNFDMPTMADGEYQRKGSLRAGLTSNGFERFNDVELSPAK